MKLYSALLITSVKLVNEHSSKYNAMRRGVAASVLNRRIICTTHNIGTMLIAARSLQVWVAFMVIVLRFNRLADYNFPLSIFLVGIVYFFGLHIVISLS